MRASYPGWKSVTSVPVPLRGPAIGQPLARTFSNSETSVLTVRRDPRDRSPISVSEIFRTFIPSNDRICHVDGEAVVLGDYLFL